MTHWKRLWCWEGLGAGGEGDDRGWDGWMASPTWWTWVWVNSGRWWWTGRPGVLRFMGLQRVGRDWATELNWKVLKWYRILPLSTSIGALLTNLWGKAATLCIIACRSISGLWPLNDSSPHCPLPWPSHDKKYPQTLPNVWGGEKSPSYGQPFVSWMLGLDISQTIVPRLRFSFPKLFL